MKNVAQQINELHKSMVRNTVETASQIGKLLCEQKAALKHGQWEPWIAENLDFSKATAKRYMNIYEFRTENENVNWSDLKLSELYAGMTEKKRTPQEKKERREALKKQDEARTNRRKKFANRKHNYINPPKGKYLNEIICGKFEDVMVEMAAHGMKDKFDALICSIPYNNGKEYGNSYDDRKDYADYLKMIKLYIRLSYALLRKSGRLIINFDEMTRKGLKGDHHHMLETDIVNIVRKLHAEGIEFYEMEKIVWYKKNSGSDWLTCRGSVASPSSPKFINKFETILVFCKQEDRLPALEGMTAGITKDEFQKWTNNVWDIHPVNAMTPHPAAYTPELCERLIKLFTWQGGLVADFFCGSGTTCKVAQELNRTFCGVDQNANFTQYSRDRLDMSKEELREKYAEFVGGRTKKADANKKGNKAA